MKTTCCRSTPRCATCPVLLAARARGGSVRNAHERIVTEILGGVAPRALPGCVEEALAGLGARRARRSGR